MRYRLFEIDRIISRTIAYGAVLLVLAAVFGGGVLLLSSVLASSFAQAESIAVAASTLLTYAVLQPVAQRIRRDVDRRFDRTRYDAERTVQAFAVRLRHETNVEAVTRDLAATTHAVVAPTSTSLWLVPAEPMTRGHRLVVSGIATTGAPARASVPLQVVLILTTAAGLVARRDAHGLRRDDVLHGLRRHRRVARQPAARGTPSAGCSSRWAGA